MVCASVCLSVSAPEGVLPPVLTVISDQTLRVSWTPPQKPNGEISAYRVFIDGRKISTNQTTSGSIVVPGLQPYTIYRIWVRKLDWSVTVQYLYQLGPKHATQTQLLEFF